MTTATADGKQLFAVCVDRKTGEILHDLKLFEQEKPQPLATPFNSYASPTPAIEEGRVYVHFGIARHRLPGHEDRQEAVGAARLALQPLPRPRLVADPLRQSADPHLRRLRRAVRRGPGQKATGRRSGRRTATSTTAPTTATARRRYGTPTVIAVKGKPQLVSPAAVATTALRPEDRRGAVEGLSRRHERDAAAAVRPWARSSSAPATAA